MNLVSKFFFPISIFIAFGQFYNFMRKHPNLIKTERKEKRKYLKIFLILIQ